MSIYDCHNRSPFWFGEPNCENPQADEPVTLIPLYGPDPKLQGAFPQPAAGAREERAPRRVMPHAPVFKHPWKRSRWAFGSATKRPRRVGSPHACCVRRRRAGGPPGDGRQSPQKICYFLFRRRRPASHVLPWWVHNPVLSVNGTRFCKASKSGRSISHTNKLSDNAPEKCDSTAA